MQDKTKTIFISLLALLFVVSTVYLSFSPNNPQKQARSNDLVSILSKTTKNNTGLTDIPNGASLPNWKLAVIQRAKQELPDVNVSNPQPIDTTTLNDPNNITAQYAKNVYTATAVLNQDGTLTAKEKAAIAASVFNQDLLKATSKTYLLGDLHTTKVLTNSSIKTYGNALGKVVFNGFAGMGKYEDLPLLEKLAQNPDQKTIDSLDQKIGEVAKFRDALLTITVPQNAVLFHLGLVNALEAYRQTLFNMRMLQTDALRASIGAHDYPFVLNDVYVNASAFIDYFVGQGIMYSKGEYGSIFTTKETTK